MTNRISRLAPSPTGSLHLGNARTFLVNWALARQGGWRLLMRVEDLDGPRIRTGSIAETLDLLAWLGLDHDGEVVVQSEDIDVYRAAMRRLSAENRVYPCGLTRREIEAAASAPQDGVHETRFDPALRGAPGPFGAEDTNYRLVVAPGVVQFDDEVTGRLALSPAEEVGDFVVWTRRGVPAYQLAVVVDDARQGVTDVVRGDDLLTSTPRQILLYDALGRSPPTWWHLPLVLGSDGRRLAKRHGDTRLGSYRGAGVPAERVIGLLAAWSGVTSTRRVMDAADFRDAFELARLPRHPVTFTEDDDAWLLDRTGRRS